MTSDATFKPMLAWNKELTDADLDNLKYPVMASYKYDGIRATIQNGLVLSRSLKRIPNLHTQKLFGHQALNGLDGEFVLGSPTAKDVCNVTGSAVGSIKGEPKVDLYVFDHFSEMGFSDRYSRAKEMIEAAKVVFENLGIECPLKLVKQTVIFSKSQLLELETKALAAGYEGLMIRSLRGPYKQGRSTWNEGYLLKLKRFTDSEAEIIGFEEQMRNENPMMTNELGHAARSKHQANMVPANTLGAFICRGVEGQFTGVEFNVGGSDEKTNKEVWLNREKYLGQVIKYKYQAVGVKDKPRIPQFLGFRSDFDRSN